MDLSTLTFNSAGVKTAAVGAASTFADWLVYCLIAVVIALIVWGCFYLLSFKNLVRVRQLTGSGYVVIDTKAREFVTKDGVKKWRLLKFIRTPVLSPPLDYLEFTKKGQFSAEADRNATGVVSWRKRSGAADVSDVFTNEERLITMQEMRRANEYNKQNTMDKIMQAMPYIMCVIIVVLIFAFWGDFVESTSDAANQAATANQHLADAMNLQNEILSRCEGNINWSKQQVIVDLKGNTLPNLPN
jgi:phosphate/sulfate permease